MLSWLCTYRKKELIQLLKSYLSDLVRTLVNLFLFIVHLLVHDIYQGRGALVILFLFIVHLLVHDIREGVLIFLKSILKLMYIYSILLYFFLRGSKYRPIRIVFFIVLAHWSNSLSHSYTLSWFRANQSLLFLLNTACLVQKQQMPIT
jgi:hypothetical protein